MKIFLYRVLYSFLGVGILGLFVLLLSLEVSYALSGRTGGRLDPVMNIFVMRPEKLAYENDQRAAVYTPKNTYSINKIKDNKFIEEDITLAFVGDIMLDRGVKASVEKNAGGDYSYLFKKVTIPKDVDVLFGNLEGPVSSDGEDIGNIYSFRMDPQVLPVLKGVGFDVLSISNNHIGDWGRKAAQDTKEQLLAELIASSGWGGGSLSEALTIIRNKGFIVGYLSFSDVGPVWLATSGDDEGIFLANTKNLEKFVSDAKEYVDILVVSFHFGEEYQDFSNNRQKRLSYMAIDLGADIVIGHHPHVVQEVEEYKDGVIAYSLGNFIFDQYFSSETMTGLMLLVDVDKIGIRSYKPGYVSLNETFQIEAIVWGDDIEFIENE